MAPSNPIELLQQITEENDILQEADSITEDMLKAYQNNCPDPARWHGRTAANEEELLEDIKQFNHTSWVEFAAETRLTHPTSTDLFMRQKGYFWGDPEEGDYGYIC